MDQREIKLLGLSLQQVLELRKTHGENVLESSKPRSLWASIFHTISEPMFLLLIACIILYLFLGDRGEAMILALAIIVVIVITIVQERRTENTLDKLKDLSSPRALVIRGGIRTRIAAKELVPGDLVEISEGDRVPADGLWLEARSLKIDESLLSGESFAVEKTQWNGVDLLKAAKTESVILTQANVSIGDEVNEVVKKALDTHGKVDILVNNAGTTRDNLLALMPEKDWDEVLSTNLKSVFLFTKACTRPMVKQRSGNIINITSIVGITGNAGQTNYAASKAGMIAFTKSTAKELAKRNIRVNAIAPGFIKTRMTGKLSSDLQEKVVEQIPLARMGEPQEIADVALFLASEASRYMTGQVLVVDGGLVI